MAKTINDYHPGGVTKRGTREPLSNHDKDIRLSVEERLKNVNWPVLGVIVAVNYADSERNISRQVIATPDDTLNRTLTADGLIKNLAKGSTTKGPQIECDVRIVEGLSDGNTDQPLIRAIPMCNTFGGIEDYGMIIPRARANSATPGETGNGDGDYCLVQFIGGYLGRPVITHIFPHPLNTHDPQRVIDGKSAQLMNQSVP